MSEHNIDEIHTHTSDIKQKMDRIHADIYADEGPGRGSVWSWLKEKINTILTDLGNILKHAGDAARDCGKLLGRFKLHAPKGFEQLEGAMGQIETFVHGATGAMPSQLMTMDAVSQANSTMADLGRAFDTYCKAWEIDVPNPFNAFSERHSKLSEQVQQVMYSMAPDVVHHATTAAGAIDGLTRLRLGTADASEVDAKALIMQLTIISGMIAMLTQLLPLNVGVEAEAGVSAVAQVEAGISIQVFQAMMLLLFIKVIADSVIKYQELTAL